MPRLTKLQWAILASKNDQILTWIGITQREKNIQWYKHEFISDKTIDSLDKYKKSGSANTLDVVHFIVGGEGGKTPYLNERFETSRGIPQFAEVTECDKKVYVGNKWDYSTPNMKVETKNEPMTKANAVSIAKSI